MRTYMKAIALILVGVAILWGVMGVMALQHQTPLATPLESAKALCDYSHHIDSGSVEEMCGQALDKVGMNYACDFSGNTCWLVKK